MIERTTVTRREATTALTTTLVALSTGGRAEGGQAEAALAEAELPVVGGPGAYEDSLCGIAIVRKPLPDSRGDPASRSKARAIVEVGKIEESSVVRRLDGLHRRDD